MSKNSNIYFYLKSTKSIKFSQQILVGRLLWDFYLNPAVKSLSYPLMIVNNNLLHKIYFKNIVNIIFLFLFYKQKKLASVSP